MLIDKTKVEKTKVLNTIQDLIDKLNKVENKKRKVVLMGCDCSGSWDGTFEETEEKDDDKVELIILLNR